MKTTFHDLKINTSLGCTIDYSRDKKDLKDICKVWQRIKSVSHVDMNDPTNMIIDDILRYLYNKAYKISITDEKKSKAKKSIVKKTKPKSSTKILCSSGETTNTRGWSIYDENSLPDNIYK